MNRIIKLAVFHLGEYQVESLLTEALTRAGVNTIKPEIDFYEDWIVRYDYLIRHNSQGKIKISDIQSKDKNRSVVRVRQVLMWWVKSHYDFNLAQTARFVCGEANRDHSTVIHSIDAVNDFLSVNDKLITEMTESIEKYTLTREKRVLEIIY